MKLTAQQTAERLDLSVSQVRTRMLRGELTDVSGKGPGKHILYFDSREVEEYRKVMKAVRVHGNGNGSHAAAPPKPLPLLDHPPEARSLGAIARIEAKLDAIAGPGDALQHGGQVDRRLVAICERLEVIEGAIESLAAAWK